MTSVPTELGLPSHFPSFRKYPGFDQLQLAVDLARNLKGVRFSALQAPPGSGKSVCAMSMHALMDRVLVEPCDGLIHGPGNPQGRTIYLVGTKSLQEQLMRDFRSMGMRDVRGHRNYPCAVRIPPGINPDDPEYRCSTPRDCQHARDIEAALSAPVVVSNYAYWMTIARYASPDLLGEFDLLVMDEAHEAPSWLTDFVAVTLNRNAVYGLLGLKLPAMDPTDLSGWADWSQDALAVCRTRYKEGERSLQRLKMLGKALALLSHLNAKGFIAASTYQQPWIGVLDPDGVKFTPVWGSDFAEQYLFRSVPRVLLCSATITPSTLVQLGISTVGSEFIEIPSPFDAVRRPIIYTPTVNVDFRMTSVHKDILAERLDKYIESRLALGKGIIHSRSYRYAAEIIERSAFSSVMIGYRDSREFKLALQTYMEHDGVCILVGPSFEEGVSFDGELARWQVIYKVQVMDSRDPLMQARIKADKKYRDMVTGESILQMAGRVVRSTDDWGETAIFDTHWGHVQNIYFPRWFRDSFRRHDGLGVPSLMEVKQVIRRP